MYSPPHEFSVNIPRILSEIRRESYDAYTSLPFGLARRTSTRRYPAVLSCFATVSAVLVVIALAASGISQLTRSGGSPYGVLPYAAILPLFLVPFAVGCIVVLRGLGRFARESEIRLRNLVRGMVLMRTSVDAATLRYLGGGGEGCHEEESLSQRRRVLHHLVSYGFSLCLFATIAAAIEQDLAGIQPPYSWVSAPVIMGLAGGVSLALGSSLLLFFKSRQDAVTTDLGMAARDYGLLIVLDLLALTGIAVLMTRTTAAYGSLLLLHLATVGTSLVVAPYTKFVHWIYRVVALAQNNLEQDRDRSAAAVRMRATEGVLAGMEQ